MIWEKVWHYEIYFMPNEKVKLGVSNMTCKFSCKNYTKSWGWKRTCIERLTKKLKVLIKKRFCRPGCCRFSSRISLWRRPVWAILTKVSSPLIPLPHPPPFPTFRCKTILSTHIPLPYLHAASVVPFRSLVCINPTPSVTQQELSLWVFSSPFVQPNLLLQKSSFPFRNIHHL